LRRPGGVVALGVVAGGCAQLAVIGAWGQRGSRRAATELRRGWVEPSGTACAGHFQSGRRRYGSEAGARRDVGSEPACRG